MTAPFSNGSEYMIWLEQNCFRCKLNSYIDEQGNYVTLCDIEEALAVGSITGDVPEPIVKRMGKGSNCPEKQPLEE